MNETKHAIILTLQFLIVKGKKHYLVLSIDTLQALLKEYHHIDVQRRWLFYCLAYIQGEGYIKRKGRWRRDERNLIRRQPSMITFTLLGAKYLTQKAVQGGKELYKLIHDWIQREQKRWPQPSDINPPGEEIDTAAALQKIRTLIKDIG